MKKVLTMVIVLVIALFLVNNFVTATNTNDEGRVITLTNSTNNTANNTTGDSSPENNTVNSAGNNTNNAVNNNNSSTFNNTANNTTSLYNNNANNDLPKTGAADTAAIMIFIVLGIISAIYSFKRMSDYQANA